MYINLTPRKLQLLAEKHDKFTLCDRKKLEENIQKFIVEVNEFM